MGSFPNSSYPEPAGGGLDVFIDGKKQLLHAMEHLFIAGCAWPLPGYVQSGDNFFKAVDTKVTYYEAKADCQRDGGYLFMWKTEKAFNDSKPILGRSNHKLIIKPLCLESLFPHGDIWAGAVVAEPSFDCRDNSTTIRDPDCEGIFEWIDGTPFSNPREDW